MSRQGRWEYLKAIYPRYHQASRVEKRRILDEFCQVTRYHRKSALRLLNGPRVIQVLAAIWRAAGYPWSVRLKALLPLWLPWARPRFRLPPTLEEQLPQMSPRQMDRRLAPYRRPGRTGRYGGTKPGALLKHHIPLRTDRWDVTVPGFTEIDLVAHGGESGAGEFAHSLNLTNIHTTWVETRAEHRNRVAATPLHRYIPCRVRSDRRHRCSGKGLPRPADRRRLALPYICTTADGRNVSADSFFGVTGIGGASRPLPEREQERL